MISVRRSIRSLAINFSLRLLFGRVCCGLVRGIHALLILSVGGVARNAAYTMIILGLRSRPRLPLLIDGSAADLNLVVAHAFVLSLICVVVFAPQCENDHIIKKHAC